jgi:hypothetical protein
VQVRTRCPEGVQVAPQTDLLDVGGRRRQQPVDQRRSTLVQVEAGPPPQILGPELLRDQRAHELVQLDAVEAGEGKAERLDGLVVARLGQTLAVVVAELSEHRLGAQPHPRVRRLVLAQQVRQPGRVAGEVDERERLPGHQHAAVGVAGEGTRREVPVRHVPRAVAHDEVVEEPGHEVHQPLVGEEPAGFVVEAVAQQPGPPPVEHRPGVLVPAQRQEAQVEDPGKEDVLLGG